MKTFRWLLLTIGCLLSWLSPAAAELLALLNSESKPGQPMRREGIAIMDIDPESVDYGKILMEIPLPRILYPHGIAIHNGIDRILITSTRSSRICRTRETR
jgi:hypothetical protein